jgi:hypothetical protein
MLANLMNNTYAWIAVGIIVVLVLFYVLKK